MSTRRTTWVVPCYNEAERLDPEQVAALVAEPGVHVVFVNDGSKDGTQALLESLAAAHPERVEAMALAHNSGKGEAVRHGLLAAQRTDTRAVGYLDADFATPPQEAHRMLALFESQGAKVAMGARVRRLGADIDRSRMRHYLGRLFATMASASLRLPVYDTQCGAKLFAVSPAFEQAIAAPFQSRWAFDVELIGRLLDAGLTAEDFIEIPLMTWRDVRGSKLTGRAMVSAGLDVLRIAGRRLK